MKKVNKAIAYCRVASRTQLDNRNGSLELQKEAISNFAKEHNVAVVKQWEDTGSGKAKLRAIYEFCKANQEIRHLLVITSDRLSRFSGEYQYWNKKFASIGVEIQPVTKSPQEVFTETIQAATKAYYSGMISERVKRGLKQKALELQKLKIQTKPLTKKVNS